MKYFFTILLIAGIWGSANGQTYDFHAADSLLDATYSSLYAGKVVCMIKQGDSLIYYKSLGGYDSTSVALIASVSKTFSAAVMLHLVSNGTLSLDDSIGQYIPSASQFGHGNCTIRQCFAHTAGYPFKDTPTTTVIETGSITLQYCADTLVKVIPYDYNPGDSFEYSGVAMQIAGAAAEIASGSSWDALFDSTVATPCGLTQSSYLGASPTNPQIAGGMISTPRDVMKFASMILHNGKINNIQVIDSAVIQEMWKDQTNAAPIISTPFPINPYDPYGQTVVRYGVGCWEDVYNPNTQYEEEISGDGAFGTSFWVDRCRNLTGVIFTSSNFVLTLVPNLHIIDIARNAVGGGCGAATQIATVGALQNNITVSPNPTDQSVSVSFDRMDANGNLKVLDATGRVVFDKQIKSGQREMEINTGALATGIYFIRISSRQKTFNKKLVITR